MCLLVMNLLAACSASLRRVFVHQPVSHAPFPVVATLPPLQAYGHKQLLYILPARTQPGGCEPLHTCMVAV
jgi:hypothetical protein